MVPSFLFYNRTRGAKNNKSAPLDKQTAMKTKNNIWLLLPKKTKRRSGQNRI
jgi:hypothetical protein